MSSSAADGFCMNASQFPSIPQTDTITSPPSCHCGQCGDVIAACTLEPRPSSCDPHLQKVLTDVFFQRSYLVLGLTGAKTYLGESNRRPEGALHRLWDTIDLSEPDRPFWEPWVPNWTTRDYVISKIGGLGDPAKRQREDETFSQWQDRLGREIEEWEKLHPMPYLSPSIFTDSENDALASDSSKVSLDSDTSPSLLSPVSDPPCGLSDGLLDLKKGTLRGKRERSGERKEQSTPHLNPAKPSNWPLGDRGRVIPSPESNPSSTILLNNPSSQMSPSSAVDVERISQPDNLASMKPSAGLQEESYGPNPDLAADRGEGKKQPHHRSPGSPERKKRRRHVKRRSLNHAAVGGKCRPPALFPETLNHIAYAGADGNGDSGGSDLDQSIRTRLKRIRTE